VAAAVAFGLVVGFVEGPTKASEFFAGYLLEQSLSVDNLFVFVLIFSYFKVPTAYQVRTCHSRSLSQRTRYVPLTLSHSLPGGCHSRSLTAYQVGATHALSQPTRWVPLTLSHSIPGGCHSRSLTAYQVGALLSIYHPTTTPFQPLSVDNLFLFLPIFSYFKLPTAQAYQVGPRALLYHSFPPLPIPPPPLPTALGGRSLGRRPHRFLLQSAYIQPTRWVLITAPSLPTTTSPLSKRCTHALLPHSLPLLPSHPTTTSPLSNPYHPYQPTSVNNIFAFSYFIVPTAHQPRVLTYGIAGAVIFRAIMIGLGIAAIQAFEAVNLLFAAVLIFCSYKLLAEAEDEDDDLSNNSVVKFCQKLIPITDYYDGNKFYTTTAAGVQIVSTQTPDPHVPFLLATF
ncbi:unnamed protein product, partial [Closterium sp. Naga37s-1]